MLKVPYYRHRECGIDTYTLHLVESIGSAPKGTFEPVAAAIQPDISRQFSDSATFVVRWARKSDCMVLANIEVNFYLDKGQLTGRILVFAVGAGKAAISISYWAAKELLENRRGLLVAFCDSRTLDNATAESIGDESQKLRYSQERMQHENNTAPASGLSVKPNAWGQEFRLNASIAIWLGMDCRRMQ